MSHPNHKFACLTIAPKENKIKHNNRHLYTESLSRNKSKLPTPVSKQSMNLKMAKWVIWKAFLRMRRKQFDAQENIEVSTRKSMKPKLEKVSF